LKTAHTHNFVTKAETEELS